MTENIYRSKSVSSYTLKIDLKTNNANSFKYQNSLTDFYHFI